MAKEFTTAPILVNSEGAAIPQYLDTSDTTDSPQGTYKPITKEILTELAAGNISVENFPVLQGVSDADVLEKVTELDAKIQSIIDGTTPATTLLTGSTTTVDVQEEGVRTRLETLETSQQAIINKLNDVTINNFPESQNVQVTGEKIDEFITNQNQIMNVLNDDYAIMGVYWNKGSDPTLTRTDAAEGKVANVGVDGELVQNDFDSMPIYRDIHEVKDDLGNEFVRIPKFYIRKKDGNGFKLWQISKKQHGGFYLPWCFWDFENSKELPYVDIGKYKAGLSENDELESKPNEQPLVDRNIVQFRGYARNNGAGYQQLDVHAWDVIQTLFYVEFATLHSQSIMNGFVSGQYSSSHTATVAESGVNRIIVSDSTASGFLVGQSIGIGSNHYSNNVSGDARVITDIDDAYDDENTAIYFDGDPIDVAIGNVVANRGYKNGFSSNVLASSGSIVSNSDGKHPCVYRGIESPWGDIWQFVDGININDYQTWVAKNAVDYSSNVYADPYEKVGYVNSDSNGYAEEMGHDADQPFIELPQKTGGSSSTYYADYYYQSAGQRIALVGGVWHYGSSAGLSYWRLSYSSGSAIVSIGGRLLRKAL